MTDTEKAIVNFLQVKAVACEPREVIESLSIKYDPWELRGVIWDLLAAGEIDLTWDRKLKNKT